MAVINNYSLIDLIRQKAPLYLSGKERDEHLLKKMLEVDRVNFLPEESQKNAYLDEPLSIGFNQTCSQPSMVAFILDMLNIKLGSRILEIGSGCGYAAAIASKMCGYNGKVWAVEIIPELAKIMQKNIRDKFPNITIVNSDGSKGLPMEMPFDKIFLSAGVNSATFDKEILINQLSENGVLIYPEARGSLYKITKNKKENIIEEYYGVNFVPLKGKNG